jgi:hypothetical protein
VRSDEPIRSTGTVQQKGVMMRTNSAIMEHVTAHKIFRTLQRHVFTRSLTRRTYRHVLSSQNDTAVAPVLCWPLAVSALTYHYTLIEQ